jgi:Tfp pilus assembly PilM family ATPase
MVPDKEGYRQQTFPLGQKDVFTVFRKNLSEAMKGIRQISVVTNHQTGVKVLPFPENMDNTEILEHLQLKREEYFGVKHECEFTLRPTAGLSKEGREFMVSYINKSFLNRIKQICREEGFGLNRVASIVETMIGSYRAQNRKIGDKPVCLLNIGYGNINMVVLKKGKPLAVRTSLAGSVKEIENRLMSVLKLGRDEVFNLLTGKTEVDENSLEIIQQNERELLSRISPFFAYLRSLGANVANLEIFLAMPYISLPGLPGLLQKNFTAKVVCLNAGQKAEKKSAEEKVDFLWLAGILEKNILSFSHPGPAFLRFNLNSRMAWMFILFFLLAPLGLAKIRTVIFENQLTTVKNKYSEIEDLFAKAQKNKQSFETLETIGNLAQTEIRKSSSIHGIIERIAVLIGDDIRLEAIKFSGKNEHLLIKGISIDSESAIRLWERLEKLRGLSQVQINFSDKSSDGFPVFNITARTGEL